MDTFHVIYAIIGCIAFGARVQAARLDYDAKFMVGQVTDDACEDAARGSIRRHWANFYGGSTCKCAKHTALAGSDTVCTGRYFNPNVVKDKGCACAGQVYSASSGKWIDVKDATRQEVSAAGTHGSADDRFTGDYLVGMKCFGAGECNWNPLARRRCCCTNVGAGYVRPFEEQTGEGKLPGHCTGYKGGPSWVEEVPCAIVCGCPTRAEIDQYQLDTQRSIFPEGHTIGDFEVWWEDQNDPGKTRPAPMQICPDKVVKKYTPTHAAHQTGSGYNSDGSRSFWGEMQDWMSGGVQ